MLNALRIAAFIVAFVCTLPASPVQAHSIADDFVGIICDPVKLRAGSENILEAVERMNALVGKLSATERQTNADLKDRISQVQAIVDEVISDVDSNVTNIDSTVKELETRVEDLEKKIYQDISAVMFQLTCVVEQAGSDQMQRSLAAAIGNIKRADPHIEILGIRIISLATNDIQILDPDKAYISTRDAIENGLKSIKETDAAYTIISAYSNIIRFARYASCSYLGIEPLSSDLLHQQLQYAELLAPWKSISHTMQ